MKTINKEYIINLKNDKKVTVDVTVDLTFDSNYGADIDGNRGIPMLFIDDVCMDIPDFDDNGDELTDIEKDELTDILDQEIDDTDWSNYYD